MPKKLALIIIVIIAIFGLSQTSYFQAHPTEISINNTPLISGKTTAIFAAYSADGKIPDYVIDYLKKLKKVAPNIIYITDNPIHHKEITKITPYANQIIAKRHGEYDWGSYKRGYNLLKRQNFLPKIPMLILANDSSLLVAQSLEPIINKAYTSNADIFGITANQDGTYHIQSYFLALKPKLFNHHSFDAYLNSVKPEKDGLTVAYRYEVPFTEYMHHLGFKNATYIPYKKLSHLPLNDKNCYPLTLLTQFNAPFLKMRTFTERLNVQEPRRLVFNWVKKHSPESYKHLIKHLKHIKSPYLKEAR